MLIRRSRVVPATVPELLLPDQVRRRRAAGAQWPITLGAQFSFLSTDFDGVNQYSETAAAEDFYNFDLRTEALSFGCWFKTNGAINGILMSRMLAGPTGYSLEVVSDERIIFDCQHGAGGQIRIDTTSLTIHDSEWHHVLLTYNGNGLPSGAKLYFDGAIAATTPIGAGFFITTKSAAAFQIGDRELDQGTIPFDGLIDDAGIWGRELTAGEAVTIFSAGRPSDLRITPAPFADMLGTYLMGDGDTFPIILNQAKQEYATITTSTELNNGATTDEINFGNNPEYDFSDTDPFTLGCWVRVAASVATQIIMRKATGTGSSTLGYLFGLNSAGGGFLDLRFAGGGARAQRDTAVSSGLFDDDVWHLLMCSADGSGTAGGIRCWYDGIRSDGTQTSAGVSANMSNTGPLIIGRQGTSFADELKGFALHPFIINAQINDQQAKMIFGNGKPQALTVVGLPGNMVFECPLGDGDASGAGNMIDIVNGNNGTLTGGSFQAEVPTRSTVRDLTMINMAADDFVADTP